MLGISFSPQNYHHHQQFLSKLKENIENDMTFCYFSCFGWYCFRPTSMAALSSSPLVRPKPFWEGNECYYERAYCSNRYTVTAANAVSLVRKKKFFYSQTLGHA